MGAAVAVLPRPWRLKLGWWRWDEVMAPHGDYEETWEHRGRYQGQTPVARLRARGVPLDIRGALPWPVRFSDLHKSWNGDNAWARIRLEELWAWGALWKEHPRGQVCLDTALAGCAQAGLVDHCRALLAFGADPLGTPLGHSGPLMRQMWKADTAFDDQLRVWRYLVKACPQLETQGWARWAAPDDDGLGPWAKGLTAENLRLWEQSVPAVPTGPAALHFARVWARDVDLNGLRMQEGLAALKWWQQSGRLPPNAATDLLQTWLSTARPGLDAYYQDSMLAWGRLFLPGALPPRPAQGPARHSPLGELLEDGPLPWSHWAMSGPFFENLPPALRDQLFDEPDAWTARNSSGETVLDVIHRRIEETRSQSREEGLEDLARWARAVSMTQHLEEALAPAAPPPARRPRL